MAESCSLAVFPSSPEWTKTARGIAGALRRLAPKLRPIAVLISFAGRGRGPYRPGHDPRPGSIRIVQCGGRYTWIPSPDASRPTSLPPTPQSVPGVLPLQPDRDRQAAARLGVSEGAVHNWTYQHYWIPTVRIGERCVRIPSDRLEEFVERHAIPSKEEDPDWWEDFQRYRIRRRPHLQSKAAWPFSS